MTLTGFEGGIGEDAKRNLSSFVLRSRKMSDYKNLQEFKDWLISRGRDPKTANDYVSDLGPCLNHPSGPLGRFRDKKLSPNTLRRIKASLKAWAKYTGDEILKEKLEDYQLPPVERVTVKKPLTKEEWKVLLASIDKARDYHPATRAVVALMAIRGFRIGDVLRMTRQEVVQAVKTGVIVFEAKRRKRTAYGVENFRDYLSVLLVYKDWETVASIISPKAIKDPFGAAEKQVAECFRDIGKIAGLDPSQLHPHKLRRTYATHYLEAVNGDLEKLRQHMGWADIATAAKYVDYHTSEKLDNVANEMMKGMLK